MNILAVDTSTSVLNVTVQTETKCVDFSEVNGTSQHSETILPVILKKCEEAGISLKDLNLLVCTRGPGSFTGLRIAMSCLKGLSYGLSIPLVSVSTLLVYASMVESFDGVVVSALDAKKQRYYLSCYEINNDSVKKVSEEIDGNTPEIDAFLSSYDKIGVVGPDKDSFADQLKNYYKDSKKIECLNCPEISVGKILIDLGKVQYNEKGADDIGQGPVYIRKSDAEVALEERTKK